MGKRARVAVQDKRRRPQGDKWLLAHGDKTENGLQGLADEVQAALGLLDGETADELVGDPDESYRALVQGVRAAMAMEWAAAKAHGLRQTPNMLRYGAQTLTILLTLVHYAYALGMRRAREEGVRG